MKKDVGGMKSDREKDAATARKSVIRETKIKRWRKISIMSRDE